MFSVRSFLFAAVLLGLGAIIAVASLGGDPPRRTSFSADEVRRGCVPTGDLADWLITGRRDIVVFDMRGPDVDLERDPPIRGAVRCGACHASAEQGREFLAGLPASVDLRKHIVFYTETGEEPLELPAVIRGNPDVCSLDGGYEAWRREVLAEVQLEANDSAEERDAKLRHQAVRAYFTGEQLVDDQPPPPPPPTALPVRLARPVSGAAADEGC